MACRDNDPDSEPARPQILEHTASATPGAGTSSDAVLTDLRQAIDSKYMSTLHKGRLLCRGSCNALIRSVATLSDQGRRLCRVRMRL